MFLTESGRQLSEDDIDLNLVKRFLTDVQSKLLEHNDNDPVEFYKRMRILRRVGDKRWRPASSSLGTQECGPTIFPPYPS